MAEPAEKKTRRESVNEEWEARLDDLLSNSKSSMKRFHTVERGDFSISLDEIHLVRAAGILKNGDKRIIIGMEEGAIVYEPEAVEKIDYRKLAHSALLALSVPQDISEICEPFHVRIGGGNAQGEKEIGVICTDASQEYAEEKGVVFFGCWVDAVGKCSLFVWTGLIAAYKGEKKYPVGIDYYHEMRNMRNALPSSLQHSLGEVASGAILQPCSMANHLC